MKLPKWNFDHAVQLAKRAVEEKGPEYHYGHTDCVYFIKGKPSCVIGYMLSYEGVTAAHVADSNNQGVHQLCLGADAKTESFLAELQEGQDAEKPWGVVLINALKVSEDF